MQINKSILKKIYKKRKPWVHKYDFGHLLIIGGSKHYSGSPAFNALAALRAGVDLVTVVAPERAANIIASFKPDLIAYPLKGDYITKKHLPKLLEFTKNKTAVVIGGGMGRTDKVLDAVVKYLNEVEIPCVIDADAIHGVARKVNVVEDKNFLLTPHAYEFYVLSEIKVSTEIKKRVKMVKEIAKQLETTILLKGHIDVISDGKRVALNKTGCPYMTAGGMGDTLAGICGALLARDINSFDAACAAAYINGKAGELAAKKYGESTVASDLIEEISNVIKM